METLIHGQVLARGPAHPPRAWRGDTCCTVAPHAPGHATGPGQATAPGPGCGGGGGGGGGR